MGNTKLANPAPLGLMGFGMTTILLNLHNVGYFALDGIILAMGIFYGGIAQIFAGLLEYKKGNTFGLTAFTSYGSFWLTLVAILLMPKLGLTDAPNAQFLGVYLGLWGVFTLFMFFGTLKGARVLQFVFFSLTVLFALLAIGNIAGNAAIIHFAGWIGLICGASAIYLAMGEVLNEQFGRTVLPGGIFLFANVASCTLRSECCNHFRCRFNVWPFQQLNAVRYAGKNTVYHNVTRSVLHTFQRLFNRLRLTG